MTEHFVKFLFFLTLLTYTPCRPVIGGPVYGTEGSATPQGTVVAPASRILQKQQEVNSWEDAASLLLTEQNHASSTNESIRLATGDVSLRVLKAVRENSFDEKMESHGNENSTNVTSELNRSIVEPFNGDRPYVLLKKLVEAINSDSMPSKSLSSGNISNNVPSNTNRKQHVLRRLQSSRKDFKRMDRAGNLTLEHGEQFSKNIKKGFYYVPKKKVPEEFNGKKEKNETDTGRPGRVTYGLLEAILKNTESIDTKPDTARRSVVIDSKGLPTFNNKKEQKAFDNVTSINHENLLQKKHYIEGVPEDEKKAIEVSVPTNMTGNLTMRSAKRYLKHDTSNRKNIESSLILHQPLLQWSPLGMLATLIPTEEETAKWQNALVNWEEERVRAKTRFFENFSVGQLSLLNDILPAQAILDRIGVDGPVSPRLVAFLRSFSPGHLTLLQRILPADFVNALADKTRNVKAPKAELFGKIVSSKLKLIGLEADDPEDDRIVVSNLTRNDICRALKLDDNTTTLVFNLLEQLIKGDITVSEAFAKILLNDTLRDNVGEKLTLLEIPSIQDAHARARFDVLKLYLMRFYMNADNPVRENAENLLADMMLA